MLIARYDPERLVKQQRIRAKEAIDKTMLYFKPKILGRAKTIDRPYQNQTYRLTHTARAQYFNAVSTLSFYAEAQNPKNGFFYANTVKDHYSEKNGRDENWFKNAADHYNKEMEEYFQKQMIEGIK